MKISNGLKMVIYNECYCECKNIYNIYFWIINLIISYWNPSRICNLGNIIMGFWTRWKLRKAKRDMDNYLIREITNAYGKEMMEYIRFCLLLAGEDSPRLYSEMKHYW